MSVAPSGVASIQGALPETVAALPCPDLPGARTDVAVLPVTSRPRGKGASRARPGRPAPVRVAVERLRHGARARFSAPPAPAHGRVLDAWLLGTARERDIDGVRNLRRELVVGERGNQTHHAIGNASCDGDEVGRLELRQRCEAVHAATELRDGARAAKPWAGCFSVSWWVLVRSDPFCGSGVPWLESRLRGRGSCHAR
jgi:hypothetical protein